MHALFAIQGKQVLHHLGVMSLSDSCYTCMLLIWWFH